jgi:hypothetical protein
MSKKKRIYIAGKLTEMAVDYIKNVHKMIQTAEIVRKAGFSVYIPAIDFLAGAVIGDYEYYDYFDNSQPWLEVSDAIFLVPGWETSPGTAKEIAKANKLKIPVFDNLYEMKTYFEQEK